MTGIDTALTALNCAANRLSFVDLSANEKLEAARVTAGILVCYVVGVPAFGMRDFLNRVFHSLQDTRTPFWVSCVVVATNIVLNLILRIFLGANGLALATSIAGTTGMVILLTLIRWAEKLLGFDY